MPPPSPLLLRADGAAPARSSSCRRARGTPRKRARCVHHRPPQRRTANCLRPSCSFSGSILFPVQLRHSSSESRQPEPRADTEAGTRDTYSPRASRTIARRQESRAEPAPPHGGTGPHGLLLPALPEPPDKPPPRLRDDPPPHASCPRPHRRGVPVALLEFQASGLRCKQPPFMGQMSRRSIRLRGAT